MREQNNERELRGSRNRESLAGRSGWEEMKEWKCFPPLSALKPRTFSRTKTGGTETITQIGVTR